MKFETGKTYYTHSVCDHDTIFSFEIIRRTAKTVWVEVRGEVVARRVTEYNGLESFRPFGNYSMAAQITADKLLKVEQATDEAPEVEQMPHSYEVIADAPVIEPVKITAPTKLKARPSIVKLTRAEGHTTSLMNVTIESRYAGKHGANILEQANSTLRMWALVFPPTASDKVDFEITFEDGEVYKGTYLLQSGDRMNASIQGHIMNVNKQYEGLGWYRKSHQEWLTFLDTHEVS